MTIENGTAIVVTAFISMGVIIAFLLAASSSDGSLVGCASAAANRAEKSNQRAAAVARWPAARITLRQGIRVVHDTGSC